jgi:hypothetical protein
MRDELKQVAELLSPLGFKGSGRTFRRVEDEWVIVVNLQASKWGDGFFLNLAAHPIAIPTINDDPVDLKKIRAYDCLFQERVGDTWIVGADEVPELVSEVSRASKVLAERARSLRAAVATQPADVLVRNFTVGQTAAFASLHLARAALAFGNAQKACAVAEWGLEAAGDALILRVKLKRVLQQAAAAS